MERQWGYDPRELSPARMASYCRHDAMCRIDFLGTGVCDSGPLYHFAGYYPQGRMDLYAALERGAVPVTPVAEHIADSCDLCGRCDLQCHFATGLRPLEVMKALKRYIAERRSRVRGYDHSDPLYDELTAIVGSSWCSRDPAIRVGYALDPGLSFASTMPSYVVLPANEDEVASLMTFCREQEFDFAVFGSAFSVMGCLTGRDLVLDMARMKHVEIDGERGLVRAGGGVTAFELQQQVYSKGFRVQMAHPSARVCGGVFCSGNSSGDVRAIGISDRNIVDASFVDDKGGIFRYSEQASPARLVDPGQDNPVEGICTEVSYRMYPRLHDDKGFLIPFGSFGQALEFLRDLSQQRKGSVTGLTGGAYQSALLSSSAAVARDLKDFFQDQLGIDYVVQLAGSSSDEDYVRNMGYPVISQRTFRTLMLALPDLSDDEVWIHLNEMMPGDSIYKIFSDKKMETLLEVLLNPDAGKIADTVSADLRDFYCSAYQKSKMTNLVWLHDFGVIKSRMGRGQQVITWAIDVPLDQPKVIRELSSAFETIGSRWQITHLAASLSPSELGEKAVFEYDYYLDHQHDKGRMRMLQAIDETTRMINRFSRTYDSVRWIYAAKG